MTTLTIHAEDELADAIREAARKTGRSINTFLKEVIGTAVGVAERRQPPTFMRVTHRMTAEGAQEVRSVQDAFSQIDRDLWK